MRSSLSLSAFFIALGLLTGCGSSAPTADTPGLPEDFPSHSVDEIQHQIVAGTDTLQSFSAEARVQVRSPEQDQSFNAVIRQRRSDSLFMRASLFGVEGGRLLLTPDSVYYYDTRRVELRVGPASAVEEIVPVPIGSSALFENMLGVAAPDEEASWTLQADSSLYYLSRTVRGEERYTVDPTRWRVVSYVEESEGGQVVERRVFSDFQRVEGVLIPHQIIFRRPSEDLSATITYREIDLNPSNLSFDLDVPSQVPRNPFE